MDMTPKSPEPEPETPNRIQPAKPISFSNGFIKRHNHHPIPITYKECLKNHAAAMGGHALDGCGEFMPSPSSTPSDPTSLKCAACGCHRNFHRRDPDDSSPASAVPPPPLPPSSTTEYQPHHRHHPPPPAPPRSPNSSSPPPISSSYMLLALSGTNKTGGNSLPFSDLNFAANNLSSHQHHTPGSRKRFRTKFSQDQKEKMHEFADRIGWKIQKRDEEEVHRFCREVGVDRGVLKVWMHNNKNAFNSRRDLSFSGGIKMIDEGGVAVPVGENDNNKAEDDGGNGLEHDLHHGDGGRFGSESGGNANGSSSTS
ncbi:hypothetical protein Bca52824_030108 [Brassica carinata]|uniref:ZF-HD dimerization-type domain-containing protein n=1 Tax=Brassica carinata TaxID=52824 RepID=A0A8X7V443_BRACI|nr:hypothetical protein Bca52824_030108 [Brassica carinata]